jgi:hypothetical protein
MWRVGYLDPLGTGVPMPKDADDAFYARADAHIHLSNDQLKEVDDRGKVSASMMYSVARFNAWVTACGSGTAEEMSRSRAETMAYFTEQYRLMLEENLDDYIENFANYMGPKH